MEENNEIVYETFLTQLWNTFYESLCYYLVTSDSF